MHLTRTTGFLSILNAAHLQKLVTLSTRSYNKKDSTHDDKVGLREPPYLEDLKPKVGFYELLDLQLKGYDYVVLEKYQSYVHKTMTRLGFEVTDAWSAPCKELDLSLLGDKSTAVESNYKIKIYERNIQMKNALVTKLPMLIDIIHMTSPPGVSFNINRHTAADEERLYYRDSVLEKLKQDLQELKDTPLIGV
jgi:large subunit ribosomal protein L48